jgi:hypothetical protein
LLVSLPVAPNPRLATTLGPPVIALTIWCVHVAPPGQTRVPTVCRCFLYSAPRPTPQGRPQKLRSVFHAHLSRCLGESGGFRHFHTPYWRRPLFLLHSVAVVNLVSLAVRTTPFHRFFPDRSSAEGEYSNVSRVMSRKFERYFHDCHNLEFTRP